MLNKFIILLAILGMGGTSSANVMQSCQQIYSGQSNHFRLSQTEKNFSNQQAFYKNCVHFLNNEKKIINNQRESEKSYNEINKDALLQEYFWQVKDQEMEGPRLKSLPNYNNVIKPNATCCAKGGLCNASNVETSCNKLDTTLLSNFSKENEDTALVLSFVAMSMSPKLKEMGSKKYCDECYRKAYEISASSKNKNKFLQKKKGVSNFLKNKIISDRINKSKGKIKNFDELITNFMALYAGKIDLNKAKKRKNLCGGVSAIQKKIAASDQCKTLPAGEVASRLTEVFNLKFENGEKKDLSSIESKIGDLGSRALFDRGEDFLCRVGKEDHARINYTNFYTLDGSVMSNLSFGALDLAIQTPELREKMAAKCKSGDGFNPVEYLVDDILVPNMNGADSEHVLFKKLGEGKALDKISMDQDTRNILGASGTKSKRQLTEVFNVAVKMEPNFGLVMTNKNLFCQKIVEANLGSRSGTARELMGIKGKNSTDEIGDRLERFKENCDSVLDDFVGNICLTPEELIPTEKEIDSVLPSTRVMFKGDKDLKLYMEENVAYQSAVCSMRAENRGEPLHKQNHFLSNLEDYGRPSLLIKASKEMEIVRYDDFKKIHETNAVSRKACLKLSGTRAYANLSVGSPSNSKASYEGDENREGKNLNKILTEEIIPTTGNGNPTNNFPRPGDRHNSGTKKTLEIGTASKIKSKTATSKAPSLGEAFEEIKKKSVSRNKANIAAASGDTKPGQGLKSIYQPTAEDIAKAIGSDKKLESEFKNVTKKVETKMKASGVETDDVKADVKKYIGDSDLKLDKLFADNEALRKELDSLKKKVGQKVAQTKIIELDDAKKSLSAKNDSKNKEIKKLTSQLSNFDRKPSSYNTSSGALSSVGFGGDVEGSFGERLEVKNGEFEFVVGGVNSQAYLAQNMGLMPYKGADEVLLSKVESEGYEFSINSGGRLLFSNKDEKYLADLEDVVIVKGVLKQVVIKGKTISASKLTRNSVAAIVKFAKTGKLQVSNKLKAIHESKRVITSEYERILKNIEKIKGLAD